MAAAKRLNLRAALVIVIVAVSSGCASTLGNPVDPFEPVNRGIYKFNDTVDKAIFKPVAQGYRAVLPAPVRTGVSNFFSNIGDVIVALNNLLQGKFYQATSDFGRIVINTTIGIGGLFDVATVAGLEKHDEDFGQTLGRWGFEQGPFLMIPLYGPSTMRDAIGRFVDYHIDPITYVRPRHVRNILWGVKFVQRRSELLDAGTILETAALDPYDFIRDAYLQRRRNLVHDGAPPLESPDADPRKPRSEQESGPAAAERAPAVAMPSLTPNEIDALVQSLPPMMPARRTARAGFAVPVDLETP